MKSRSEDLPIIVNEWMLEVPSPSDLGLKKFDDNTFSMDLDNHVFCQDMDKDDLINLAKQLLEIALYDN